MSSGPTTAASSVQDGPRSSKGARTRARLLEAAKEIFEETGFLNARISDIADRAGLSHGSFYHYFESKEQIFREVAAIVDEQLGAPLDEVVLAPATGLSPYARLREGVRLNFETYREQARIMGIIEQVSRYDEPVGAMMLGRHRQYSRQVADSIRELQRRGLADKSLNPEVAAAGIGALTGRFAELWLVQGAIDCTMDTAVDQVTKLIVNALGIAE
ncbi:MAG TPA: TetR/AcrR family transcriptional regulator [Mycobacteriales bacterium]|nr:TetR/AcrR family transcriptional regulator [Mycobacteriales bacterium]